MSKQEFDKQDQQAINLANRNHQQPKLREGRFAKAVLDAEAEKSRELLLLVLKVLCCMLAAVLFLAAEFNPGWKTALCCIGFVAFMCMGSILLDRYCRR